MVKTGAISSGRSRPSDKGESHPDPEIREGPVSKKFFVRASFWSKNKGGQAPPLDLPLIRLQEIEGPNKHDQLAFCAFHSFLVEVQLKWAIYLLCIYLSNLEIRMEGPSSHLH